MTFCTVKYHGQEPSVEQYSQIHVHVYLTGYAGFEARGLIFGAPLALALGCAFVPLRKPGKLPGEHTSRAAVNAAHGCDTHAAAAKALSNYPQLTIMQRLTPVQTQLFGAPRGYSPRHAVHLQVSHPCMCMCEHKDECLRLLCLVACTQVTRSLRSIRRSTAQTRLRCMSGQSSQDRMWCW